MAPKSYELGPGTGYHFFQSQLTKALALPKETSVAGQTALITGGNVGIGLECANQLLELGLQRLVLAVRTPAKGESVASELRKKYPEAHIDVWQVDLLAYKSVQALGARCASSLDRLDIAILNAGMMAEKFETSPEGHEKDLQTQYLSTVLLSFLLLPTLKAGTQARRAPGRLTIVSSSAAYSAKFPTRNAVPWLPTFDDHSRFDIMEQYTSTKALAHFWAVRMAEVVRPEDVIVNLVDPGLVKGTSLHRHVSGVMSMAFSVLKSIFGRSMRVAATTYIHAAVAAGAETHGSFLMDWQIRPYVTAVYGEEGKKLIDRLWDETLKELSFARIQQMLNSL